MLAGTSLKSLGALRVWLASAGVTDATMESTGVYWRPAQTVPEPGSRVLVKREGD